MDALRAEEAIDQPSQGRIVKRLREFARQDRGDDGHAATLREPKVALRAGLQEGLLDEEDSTSLRGSRHQVIGTLKDEVPAQVRKTDEVSGHVGSNVGN